MKPTMALAAAFAIAVGVALPASAQTSAPTPGGPTTPTDTMPSAMPQIGPVDIQPPASSVAPLGNGVSVPGNTSATKTPGGIVGGPGGASHSAGGNGS
jgi:hypothetical protein